jgi:hypothetical protein
LCYNNKDNMGGNNKQPQAKDKLTDSEKKKIKQNNKALANPGKAADKKIKNDKTRAHRIETGSKKPM